jgi:hypothetical protein
MVVRGVRDWLWRLKCAESEEKEREAVGFLPSKESLKRVVASKCGHLKSHKYLVMYLFDNDLARIMTRLPS